MMNQIENLAKSGAKDQARQLLSEMQRMMNNLQAGRPQQQQQGQDNSEMRQQMDKLGQLMQEQQRLMDETFKYDQALRDRMQRGDPLEGQDQELFGQDMPQQPGQQPNEQGQQPGPFDNMTAEELKQALKDMQAQQDQLGKQLGELQKGLEGMGIKPGKGFGEAGREMKGASGALGNGQGEQAVGSQGRALQALRDGAQDMMQQMHKSGSRSGARPGPGRAAIWPERPRPARTAASRMPGRTSAIRSRCPTKSTPSAPAKSSTKSAAGWARIHRRRRSGSIWSGCWIFGEV